MDHEAVVEVLHRQVRRASPSQRRHLGRVVVGALLADDEVMATAVDELDIDAQSALATAISDYATASPAEISTWTTRIDDGTLAEGDMSPALLFALDALDVWSLMLKDNSTEHAVSAAVRYLEAADYSDPTTLEDFLGSPLVRTRFEQVQRLLTDL